MVFIGFLCLICCNGLTVLIGLVRFFCAEGRNSIVDQCIRLLLPVCGGCVVSAIALHFEARQQYSKWQNFSVDGPGAVFLNIVVVVLAIFVVVWIAVEILFTWYIHHLQRRDPNQIFWEIAFPVLVSERELRERAASQLEAKLLQLRADLGTSVSRAPNQTTTLISDYHKEEHNLNWDTICTRGGRLPYVVKAIKRNLRGMPQNVMAIHHSETARWYAKVSHNEDWWDDYILQHMDGVKSHADAVSARNGDLRIPLINAAYFKNPHDLHGFPMSGTGHGPNQLPPYYDREHPRPTYNGPFTERDTDPLFEVPRQSQTRIIEPLEIDVNLETQAANRIQETDLQPNKQNDAPRKPEPRTKSRGGYKSASFYDLDEVIIRETGKKPPQSHRRYEAPPAQVVDGTSRQDFDPTRSEAGPSGLGRRKNDGDARSQASIAFHRPQRQTYVDMDLYPGPPQRQEETGYNASMPREQDVNPYHQQRQVAACHTPMTQRQDGSRSLPPGQVDMAPMSLRHEPNLYPPQQQADMFYGAPMPMRRGENVSHYPQQQDSAYHAPMPQEQDGSRYLPPGQIGRAPMSWRQNTNPYTPPQQEDMFYSAPITMRRGDDVSPYDQQRQDAAYHAQMHQGQDGSQYLPLGQVEMVHNAPRAPGQDFHVYPPLSQREMVPNHRGQDSDMYPPPRQHEMVPISRSQDSESYPPPTREPSIYLNQPSETHYARSDDARSSAALLDDFSDGQGEEGDNSTSGATTDRRGHADNDIELAPLSFRDPFQVRRGGYPQTIASSDVSSGNPSVRRAISALFSKR